MGQLFTAHHIYCINQEQLAVLQRTHGAVELWPVKWLESIAATAEPEETVNGFGSTLRVESSYSYLRGPTKNHYEGILAQ